MLDVLFGNRWVRCEILEWHGPGQRIRNPETQREHIVYGMWGDVKPAH